MFVTPKSEITIGSAQFYGANSGITAIKIKQSVDNIGDIACITIPRNFAKRGDKGILDVLKVGDRTIIRLGYNNNINTEFTGYVSKIHDTTPIKIDLDDDWYTFKKAAVISKSWKQTTLRELLSFLFSGYRIDCPDVNLTGGYIIKNATPYEAIKALKDSYGFSTKLDAENKSISCFWAYQHKGYNTYAYVFGSRNGTTIESLRNRKLSPNIAKNSLKFVRKDDLKLQITAKARMRNGKTISCTLGSQDSDASKRTLNFGSKIIDEASLRAEAEKELNRLSYDGYEGKITGFGIPRTSAGDSLTLIDAENPERGGTYLIKTVTISYSVNGGFRRENELSYKIK